MLNIQRISAFSYHNEGGNPAGVVISNTMPDEKEMLKIAADVGYSETAFLMQIDNGWRVRYFAPEMEVPFCGHATIASGAALGQLIGDGEYQLKLNDANISINVSSTKTGTHRVTLKSPNTWSKPAPTEFVEKVLTEFNFSFDDLDPNYPVYFAFAGAKHLIFVLKNRTTLSDMKYHFEHVKALMQNENLVTINLLYADVGQTFHSRNPFPTGGVYEDPATGAAAAAFAGYLRDIKWKGGNNFTIFQGEDMGCLSKLEVEFNNSKGEGIKVTGDTRLITDT